MKFRCLSSLQTGLWYPAFGTGWKRDAVVFLLFSFSCSCSKHAEKTHGTERTPENGRGSVSSQINNTKRMRNRLVLYFCEFFRFWFMNFLFSSCEVAWDLERWVLGIVVPNSLCFWIHSEISCCWFPMSHSPSSHAWVGIYHPKSYINSGNTFPTISVPKSHRHLGLSWNAHIRQVGTERCQRVERFSHLALTISGPQNKAVKVSFVLLFTPHLSRLFFCIDTESQFENEGG